jgi:hypothetical protein
LLEIDPVPFNQGFSMKIAGISRANRAMRSLALLGMLGLAWGCGGDTRTASPGVTEDSKARQEAERKAREAAYGPKGQLTGKEAPKQ